MAALRSNIYGWLKLAKAQVPVLRRTRLLKKSPIAHDYFGRPIHTALDGNTFLREHLNQSSSFSAGKIGSAELEVLVKYHNSDGNPDTFFNSVERGHELQFLHVNSGVFPKDMSTTVYWARIYLAALAQMSFIGIWFNESEDIIVHEYAQNSTLIRDTGLEPYYHQQPWSQALEGKRVLVVTPFTDSIQHQYYNKGGAKLFPNNPQTLPEFELLVIRAPLSPALARPEHDSWHSALVDLKQQMACSEWDVCIVGAGAYSIPLCGYARADLKRAAIHMGGGTQLLFGVRGRRWEGHEVIQGLFNEHWIRPLDHETPRRKWKIEGGAYW